ncbi:MAG: glycosyl hydrolase family 18 protein [Chloroflexota bacterium]|nr:glycosyl hydrolase family 18 protein [Chloroflexota bacterium]
MPARRVLGYYVTYDPTSWAALEANAAHLDDVAGQWVTIDACGQLGSRDDQTLKQFAQSRGIRVFPSLLTGSGWLNNRLLTDEATTATAIAQIADYVEAEGYDGFDLDLEGVRPADRAAYTAFVARLGAALHERGKLLTLAIPAKAGETTTGWAAAYDYAALGQHADLITLMAYEYRGAFSGPGSVAPYDWVDRVLAFATSQIPAEKILLGLAFYGHDWNTTSGGSRALGYVRAAALAEYHGVPIVLDPETQSATFRYRAVVGEGPPPRTLPPPPQHEVTVRERPPCPVVPPAPAPTPTPRPTPPPGTVEEHEVWLEESAAATARLRLAERYNVGGVAMWRLGLEDPQAWPSLEQWRRGIVQPE